MLGACLESAAMEDYRRRADSYNDDRPADGVVDPSLTRAEAQRRWGVETRHCSPTANHYRGRRVSTTERLVQIPCQILTAPRYNFRSDLGTELQRVIDGVAT